MYLPNKLTRKGKAMIEYKGYTISEGTGVNGVKIYRALRNKSYAIASNSSLSHIVSVIDKEEENN
jgi:hypothetical protein